MNNDELVHVGTVRDGAIISFPHSCYAYMKVCDNQGIGGVVRLSGGEYIPTNQLSSHGLGLQCWVNAVDLDRYYYGD